MQHTKCLWVTAQTKLSGFGIWADFIFEAILDKLPVHICKNAFTRSYQI